jgi:MFS family permease
VLYLSSAVMQPTMGQLATLFGPRRVFLGGVAILLLGGAIGGIAPSLGVLMVSRALIGIGTSAGYPTAMALIRRRADRLATGVPSQMLGNLAIAAQVTIVVGLPIGGVLAGAFGWRAIFLFNVPLAILTLVTAWLAVEPDGPPGHSGIRRTVAFLDLPGIALFAVATVAILLFLGDLQHPAWWLGAAAVVAAAALVVWERRAVQPLIDVHMLASNAPLLRTYLRQTVLGLGVYTALYGTSQWMEAAAGYSPTEVGLILVPLSLVSIVLARLTSARGWVQVPLLVGTVALVGTGALMLTMDARSGIAAVVGMSVLFGITSGLNNFANQATLYTQAPAASIGTAAGLFRTAFYLGAIFSASVIGLTFGARVTDAGLHHLAWVIAGIGVLSLPLVAFDGAIPRTVSASFTTPG